MSMSVQVYWNTGGTNARIFQQSQGRMDVPFWRDVDNYVRNSPIHGIDQLSTPLLMTFGDKDGAVACMLLSELVAQLKSNGRTLHD